MSWIIFGGTGQLGRALSRVLDQRKFTFHIFGTKDLDIRFPIFDIQKFKDLECKVIVNAAAWTDVDGAEADYERAYAVNATGALNLASAAKDLGAVFFQISTDYVYSGTRSTPWNESEPFVTSCVYGETKAAGEFAAINKYREGTYVFRTAWLYSEWGKNFAKTITRLALRDPNSITATDLVKVVNDQIGQPTYALDVANQIVDTERAKLPFGIYHATNNGEATWFEYAEEIFKICNLNPERLIKAKSSQLDMLAKRPEYSVLGHNGWNRIGKLGFNVPPMRDWKLALHEAMPAIISAIKKEG
jgi:dTDP-4-dehydrorhamnose reductase